MINGPVSITKDWRTILNRVAILVGQSQNSDDIPNSFLLNIIALEMLLTTKNERTKNKLVERLEYLMGWNDDWYNEGYNERIIDTYNKRSDYVHTGKTKNIKAEDLIFTDELLLNALTIISKHKDKIKDKQDIIDYSEKHKARKTLNYKAKHELSLTKYYVIPYTKSDYEKI